MVTQSNNPLTPIAPFLPQAKDVGLHVIVARRTAGSSRAMYDPVLGKIKELSMPGLLGNGSRDEGQLIGNLRPSAMPPGRGTFVSRKTGKQLMQVTWIDPD